jgi:signal transduction histidine kinase
MFKMKIVHKGLMLVAVPLLTGTVFISLLLYGLSETNRLIERELMLKDATISYITVSTSSIASRRSAVCYRKYHDPFFKKFYKINKEQAEAANKHLRSLLKSEKWAQIPPLQLASGIHDAEMTDKNALSDPFLKQLQDMSDRQTRLAMNAMSMLEITLVAGLLLTASISIALTIFFCVNITNRLLIILNNTVNLSRGSVLAQPLKGTDEIAELDQFLFKSATEIEALERFKKEMIGVVSHELKSPLSSVGAFLSSLSSGVFGEISAKSKDKVERTNNSVKRLMGLVKELLYLDRLALEMKREDIEIEQVVNASIDSVKELSEKSGIEIVVKNNGARIFADKDRLVQVMVNLLSNAMKFSPERGKVTVEIGKNEGFLECRVSDQGCGIPENFRKQIFEPFKQVDSKDARSKKGTGLGLTISRSIVEQHGGSIGVDSIEGEGSTFWFKIPTSSPAQAGQNSLQANGSAALQLDKAKGSGARKFGVLQQGLVIIAVPLLFQLAFATVIGCMLYDVKEQTKREQDSREILDTLNKGVQALVTSTGPIVMYALTKKPEHKKQVDEYERETLNIFDHTGELLKDDPKQVADLKKARSTTEKYFGDLEKEAARNASNVQLQKVMDAMGGYKFMLSSNPSMMNSLPSIEGTSTLQILTELNTTFNRIMNMGKPGIEIKMLSDRVMSREKALGEKFAEKREKSIRTLQLALSTGIVLNIVLSTLLAFTLMRSLTSRLQHGMENTARLVKREELEAPINGNDEIAYLDRTLYETGMHLIELEKFKQELISIVSHELRTPLLSVSSALELFSAGVLGELSEKGLSRLKFAQDEANRLIRLINDLLDIEKMEAGKFILDKSDFQISELVQNSIAATAQLAEQKGIKIETSFAEQTINADRDRTFQVIINLLSNAIKFSPESGLIKLCVEASNDQIEFKVIDQGRGIPEEARKKIFDRFVQVEKSDETVRGGSGLGLAISRAIVEQHGGTIGVESEPSQGSTFWFRLPVSRELAVVNAPS